MLSADKINYNRVYRVTGFSGVDENLRFFEIMTAAQDRKSSILYVSAAYVLVDKQHSNICCGRDIIMNPSGRYFNWLPPSHLCQ